MNALWNPLKAISKALDDLTNFDSSTNPQNMPNVPETPQPEPKETDTSTTTVVPVQTTSIVDTVPKDAVSVNGAGSVQAAQPDITVQFNTDAKQHSEHFRKVVESFDEDKLDWLEWVIRKAIVTFCYISPFVVAFFIGMGIGDQFAVGQTGWSNVGIHLMSLFLEILMPVLGISTNIMFRRALKDRAAVPGLIGIALFFLVVSTGNAMALLVLLEKDVDMAAVAMPQLVAILVRAFGSLILDVGCTIYLTIATIRSLKKYIADQRKKIEAVRDVSSIEIQLDQANMKAAMDRLEAIGEQASRQRRRETFDEAERLSQEAVLDSMRAKLKGSDNDRGGRSRYGNGW